jgi:hypothetical protein
MFSHPLIIGHSFPFFVSKFWGPLYFASKLRLKIAAVGSQLDAVVGPLFAKQLLLLG